MTAAPSTPDAVVWNLDKVLDEKAAAFRQAPERAGAHAPALGRELDQKLDDMHGGDHHQGGRLASSPTRCSGSWCRSPAQYEKLGKDWDKFASAPSGTGPFKLDKLVPRERAELVQERRLLGQEAAAQDRPAWC